MKQKRQTWLDFAGKALILIALLTTTSPSIQAQTQGQETSGPRETQATQAQAPSPDVQQLKDRVEQLEKMVKELNGQINALETTKKTDAPTTEPIPAVDTSVGPVHPMLTTNTAPATTSTTTVAVKPKPVQSSNENKSTFEVYGHIMTDTGYQFNQNDPNWFDVVRPTKLASFPDEFGPDGKTFFGVRQTRFGVRSATPTDYGTLKTLFEFELFGTGVDAGQTTFRLRHAYGELGQFGAGQTWSPFMDIDVFPNSLEYWGPNGMVFFRNVQVCWMPIKGSSRVTIALERPGASADQGVYQNRIELQGVRPKFAYPDLSGEARYGKEWGYVEIAGMLRSMKWVDLNDDQFDLSGSDIGWGINLSSNIKFTKNDIGRFQVVYGEGIQNYMNDAPTDVAIENNFTDPRRPIKGKALPIIGIVAFLDHTWSKHFTSTGGYSFEQIDNSNGQAPNAFHAGHYALVNFLYYPVERVLMGAEFQYGRRVNAGDGFRANDYRIQISFKYNFSKLFEF